MKRILVVLCCLMLVGWTNIGEAKVLKDQQILEFDEKDYKILFLKENHKNRPKVLDSNMDALMKTRDELKACGSDLLKLYEVLSAAYRLDDLVYIDEDDDLDVTVYRMNYTFKSLTPENIVYAGAMHMTEDGWIVPTYLNSHYLIFL